MVIFMAHGVVPLFIAYDGSKIPGRFITGRFNTVGSSCGRFITGRFILEREKQLAAFLMEL